ncbi:MAG: hypothetical protein ACI8UO_000498 [Verrucomicrobiales bacterium]|jgi:hypothetical protein
MDPTAPKMDSNTPEKTESSASEGSEDGEFRPLKIGILSRGPRLYSTKSLIE